MVLTPVWATACVCEGAHPVVNMVPFLKLDLSGLLFFGGLFHSKSLLDVPTTSERPGFSPKVGVLAPFLPPQQPPVLPPDRYLNNSFCCLIPKVPAHCTKLSQYGIGGVLLDFFVQSTESQCPHSVATVFIEQVAGYLGVDFSPNTPNAVFAESLRGRRKTPPVPRRTILDHCTNIYFFLLRTAATHLAQLSVVFPRVCLLACTQPPPTAIGPPGFFSFFSKRRLDFFSELPADYKFLRCQVALGF